MHTIILATCFNSFRKTLQALEKINLQKPTNKTLVFIKDHRTNTQSMASGLLLSKYLAKIEKNVNEGITESDLIAIKQDASDENGCIECHYCKVSVNSDEITVDHLTPNMFRGPTHFSNIKLACSKCNHMKGCIYPKKMPITFDLFKHNALTKKYVSSLDVLKEVKDNENLSIEEKALVEKLINVENNWREKQKQKNELKLNILKKDLEIVTNA